LCFSLIHNLGGSICQRRKGEEKRWIGQYHWSSTGEAS
jgi:hypothetical protein